MSSDIYIPLKIVLSHRSLFELKAVLNVGVQEAADELATGKPDWWHIQDCLKPVLLCKFGRRDTWRYVDVFDDNLYVVCGGEFRTWLIHWLEDHKFQYTII